MENRSCDHRVEFGPSSSCRTWECGPGSDRLVSAAIAPRAGRATRRRKSLSSFRPCSGQPHRSHFAVSDNGVQPLNRRTINQYNHGAGLLSREFWPSRPSLWACGRRVAWSHTRRWSPLLLPLIRGKVYTKVRAVVKKYRVVRATLHHLSPPE